MNFDEHTILATQQETHFELLYIEKVLRLLDVLELFCKDPLLKDKYVLKGGTALNLFYFALPRLSVDIDLNYIGLDREVMQDERRQHEERLKSLLTSKGYVLKRVPSEHAGGKWRLGYRSFTGILQNIELDLNYMHRVPLLPMQNRSSHRLGKQQIHEVQVLDIHELAAGKLCALIARGKPRDLFDANELLNAGILNGPLLRICFVVYAAFNKLNFSRIDSFGALAFDHQQFRQELMETLADNTGKETAEIYLDRLIEGCRKKMSMILPFSPSEKEFLENINTKGEIKPELVTDSPEMCQIIKTHPMLQWKVYNVRKYFGL